MSFTLRRADREIESDCEWENKYMLITVCFQFTTLDVL